MENTVLAVISRQMNIQREMDAVANNIANLSTDGFKNERVRFAKYLIDIGNSQTLSLVKDVGVIRDFSDGPIRGTGNPFDLAIRGEGFFLIETQNDGIKYTRSGRLHFDPIGTLSNADGLPILGTDDLPIVAFPGDTSLIIDKNGRVSSESGVLGRLALVSFEDLSKLVKFGSGLYETSEEPIVAEGATILQGMLEGSNVEPITEMTRMITLLRSYQGSQTLGNEEHDLRRKAIGVLGSVNLSA